MAINFYLRNSRMFHIAVPSYKRALTLGAKTLRVLEGCGIITVFVASEEEKADYLNVCDTIVVGVPGLVEQRKFIMEYYPIGSNILMVDDDIEGFVSLRGLDIKDMITRGFTRMEEEGCNMWGISPSANRFFLKDTESTNLKYIIGCFYGIRNVRPILELAYGDSQEDKERTLRTWVRDGRILRLNWIAPITKYYAPGGIMASNPNRKRDTERDTGLLVSEFPMLVRQIAKKDTYDLRFKRGV